MGETRIEKTTNDAYLAVLTVVLGAVVGCSSLILGLVLDGVEHLFLGFVENNRVPVAIYAHPTRRLIAVLVGAVISGVIWYFLQRNWKPVGIKAAMDGQRMPVGRTAVHVLTQIFYVSTGGSIGRELAPRQAGAMIADNVSRFGQSRGWYISDDDRRLLIAAAAGAGFAGVYIAPITGTMFSIELLYQRVTKRAVAVSATMAAVATMVGSITKGFVPYYLIGSHHFHLAIIPLALLLGAVNGVLGGYFKRLIKKASAARATGKNILWQFALVGLVTGLVATIFPYVEGNGRGTAQLAFNTHPVPAALWWLVFGFVAKGAVTLFTIKGGGYGGTLTPSIALGACTGVLAGAAYVPLVAHVTLAQCGVLGAVALLAASQQAPLMALFMMYEVCHMNYSALLPMALAVAVAIACSKRVLK